MFAGTELTVLDLRTFDFSKVNYITRIFKNAKATIGYVKDTSIANKLNNLSDKPSTLTFVVK